MVCRAEKLLPQCPQGRGKKRATKTNIKTKEGIASE